MLGALGVLPIPLTRGTPVWVGVSVGLLFVLAGVAIACGYTIAASEELDGDLPPGTSFGAQLAQLVLGLGICGLLAAVFGWIAFGKGERRFSMTIDLPFLTRHGGGNEWLGRGMFGFGAAMAGAIGVVAVIRSLKKWRR